MSELKIATQSKHRRQASLYEQIREDVLSLAFPPGSDIDERSLSKRYGVSRTPVRESLIKLESDGLIELNPGRGARVSQLIVPNVSRYLESLDLLQRAIVRMGTFRALGNDHKKIHDSLSGLEVAFSTLNTAEYASVENAFSAEYSVLFALGESAHNSYLLDAYLKLLLRGQRMLRLQYAYDPNGEVTVNEFAELRFTSLNRVYEAIKNNSATNAEKRMSEHHELMVKRIIAYLSENLVSGIRAKVYVD